MPEAEGVLNLPEAPVMWSVLGAAVAIAVAIVLYRWRARRRSGSGPPRHD